MRAIDADALVNQLIAEMDADTDKSIQATLARTIGLIICKAVDEQPTIEPQRWIPCSDCERKCDKWENSKT